MHNMQKKPAVCADFNVLDQRQIFLTAPSRNKKQCMHIYARHMQGTLLEASNPA